ncbi:type II toxin-antitoxin system Phd/YefM family antitoxin [Oleisolibacter albus]|uniref:type II toxin-antitoxin system Phd/YefM family antitoxin n=1 Tax=Oleisolibacter albus TaxID=2171757 RepID=UPI000DF11899|nr:hypothetical protein [Oleisolibacter albus]
MDAGGRHAEGPLTEPPARETPTPGHIDRDRTCVALQDANNLPELVARARRGEQILIPDGGQVVARIVAVDPSREGAVQGGEAIPEGLAARRRSLFGMLVGQIDVDALQQPLPADVLDAMRDPQIIPE